MVAAEFLAKHIQHPLRIRPTLEGLVAHVPLAMLNFEEELMNDPRVWDRDPSELHSPYPFLLLQHLPGLPKLDPMQLATGPFHKRAGRDHTLEVVPGAEDHHVNQ